MKIALISAALAVFVLGSFAPFAAADNPDDCEEEQRNVESGKKKNFKTIIGPDGQKIFVIEKAFIVCGKIPRPTVIYAFQPSTINYEWENLKKDFIPLILETVQEAPF